MGKELAGLFQDDTSNPGTTFAVGLTLESLRAHTVDESGKEAFITQNPMKLLRKVHFIMGFHAQQPGLHVTSYGSMQCTMHALPSLTASWVGRAYTE